MLAIVAVFQTGMFLGNLCAEAGNPVNFNTIGTAIAAPSG